MSQCILGSRGRCEFPPFLNANDSPLAWAAKNFTCKNDIYKKNKLGGILSAVLSCRINGTFCFK